MKIKFCLMIMLFGGMMLSAQEVEFGKVSKAELEETEYANDPDADAAILYRDRNSYFASYQGGFKMITEIHERVKIYNTGGYKYATHTVDLFKTRSSNESVGKIKAYTYNLEGGKVVKTELEKDQVFKDEIRYNYNQVKFTMPDVKEGSVIEYKYKITSPFYMNIDDFVFQEEIPIKKIHAKLKTIKGTVFKPTYKGYIPIYPSRDMQHNSRIDLTMVIDTYNLQNVPAMKEEAYVDNIENYRAGITFELISIELPEFYRSYAKSWKDVAQVIGNTDDYEDDLDKPKHFKDKIDPVIAGKTSEMDKMKAIFDYVKKSITWNGLDGKYFYHGIKKALEEKKGNSGDINLSLVAMLRYAGLDANPLVISTKDNLFPLFPTVDRLNYVLAYVKIGDKQYFLDATDEFSDINLLPIKDYNWKGILINNRDMVWNQVGISPPKPARAQYQLNAAISDDGSIEGDYKSKLTGHHAYMFRKGFKDSADEDTFITEREDKFNEIEISDYSAENTDIAEGDVVESFSFFHEDGANVVDDKIYVHPMFFLRSEENPFKAEERLYPIDFGYTFKDMYMIKMQIPEGYAVESELKPMIVKLPNNEGLFRFSPNLQDQTLNFMVSFEINREVIGADTYLMLKEFFNQVITKQAEQVVLKRI